MLLSECYLRLGAGLLVAAGCCFKMLLSECCLRFGAGLLARCSVPLCRVLLSAVRALELACWCRCRVPLFRVPVEVPCALWSWLAGAAAGCRCRVLPTEGCVRLRNLAAATGCCCKIAVCAVKLGCWCRSRAPLLWNLGVGAAAGGRRETSFAVGIGA
eukprot:s105_g50.t1